MLYRIDHFTGFDPDDFFYTPGDDAAPPDEPNADGDDNAEGPSDGAGDSDSEDGDGPGSGGGGGAAGSGGNAGSAGPLDPLIPHGGDDRFTSDAYKHTRPPHPHPGCLLA